MNETSNKRVLWLESYIDQSLTFSSWTKLETQVGQLLKENVEDRLTDPVQRQIVFQILGNDFMKKNFPHYVNSPETLDKAPRKEREKKLSEMKAFIKSVCDNAIQKKSSQVDDRKFQSDLAAFSKDLHDLIEREHRKQQVKSKKKQGAVNLNEKFLEDVLSYDPTISTTLIFKLQKDVAVLTDSLRHILWPVCIANKEKGKNKKNEEKLKEFSNLYVENQSRRKSSVSTEDSKSMSTVVRKIYKEAASLKFLNTAENIRCSVDILNISHMYGMKFQPHYPFYAAVIQQVYLKNKSSDDEDYGAASMMLDKLLRLCVPSSNQVLKISNRILQILHEVDQELISHIKKYNSSVVTNVGGRKSFSSEADSSLLSQDNDSKSHRSLPVVYIKKWITEGFVSILKLNCLLFVWDQLYLSRWEHRVIEEVCLVLLGLLKQWFMLSKNQEEIEKVFLDEPQNLYLLDIRRAFDHIHKKGSFLDIPHMNRNIRFETDPVPTQTPAPPPPPISPKFVPPKPNFLPWVPFNKEKSRDSNQPRCRVDQPFDFYIDSVRFVPDNATVVKITGKILNMYFGEKEKFIKFQSFPDFASHWRYPKFKMRQTVNRESVPMNPDVVIMIRVYTIEQHSKDVTVLGSCLFGPFSNKHNKQVSLRVGGHQIRVRHGIPNPEFNVENMSASHMDENPAIPGVTVLLRVLPHQKDYIEAPSYETNYYRSDEAEPNESERRLYKHYQESKDFTMTEREVALLLCGQSSANDEALLKMMQQLLKKEGSDVEDFPYQRFVRYDQEQGIMVLADKASALPLFLEGRYLQCLVQVLPGEDTRIGNGKNQVSSFITEELDLDSPQRSPDWSDPPMRVKPEYDPKCVIFVTLYGLRPRFDASVERVIDKDGREPNFNLQHAIAWSATNCFDKESVCAGTHHLPLIKGRPSDDIIEKLSYLPLDYICKNFKGQVKVFEASSIEIAVWDGRFSFNECPPLPTHTTFLNISLNPEKYIKASEQVSGVAVKVLLQQGLQNQSEFNKYKARILKLLKVIFKENIDRSLRKAGYDATL